MDFVSFEDGLNTAVRKLRQALNDSAESARFVETIPKRGYRFIATVEFGQRPALRPEPEFLPHHGGRLHKHVPFVTLSGPTACVTQQLIRIDFIDDTHLSTSIQVGPYMRYTLKSPMNIDVSLAKTF